MRKSFLGRNIENIAIVVVSILLLVLLIGNPDYSSITSNNQQYSIEPLVLNYSVDEGSGLVFDMPAGMNYSIDFSEQKTVFYPIFVLHNNNNFILKNVEITEISDCSTYTLFQSKGVIETHPFIISEIPANNYKIFFINFSVSTTDVSQKDYCFSLTAQTREGDTTNIEAYITPYYLLDLNSWRWNMPSETNKSVFIELQNEVYPCIYNNQEWSDLLCILPNKTILTLPKTIISHSEVDFFGNPAPQNIWTSEGLESLRVLKWDANLRGYNLPIGTKCGGTITMSYGWRVNQTLEGYNYNPPVLVTFKAPAEINIVSTCTTETNLTFLIGILFFILTYIFAHKQQNKIVTGLCGIIVIVWLLQVMNYKLISYGICFMIPILWITILYVVCLTLIYLKTQKK